MKNFTRILLVLLFTGWSASVYSKTISIGFEYEVVGDGAVTSMLLPNFAVVQQVGPYQLQLFDNMSGSFTLESLLGPGELFDFEPMGVKLFRIIGINESLMLDPDNASAFPLGLTTIGFSHTTELNVTALTKEITEVPVPAMFSLLGLGIFYITWVRFKSDNHST